MKKTTRMKLGMMLTMGLSIGILAGCSQEEEEKQQTFMSNKMTPDDIKATEKKEKKKTSGFETVEGWAYTGDEFFKDVNDYGYSLGGFQGNDTLVINVVRYQASTYSMYYKISPGMTIPIGQDDVKVTLLEADAANSKIRIKIESLKGE